MPDTVPCIISNLIWRVDFLGRDLTRREFLKVAGAGVGGAALLGAGSACGGTSYLPGGGSRMNVVVVNLDSLRRDHKVCSSRFNIFIRLIYSSA